MASNFYETYMKFLSKNPQDKILDDCQESIDYGWEEMPNVVNILAQDLNNFNQFVVESVMITSAINSTTGQNFGDNYLKIIHKNYKNSNNTLGRIYKFENMNETYKHLDGKWISINANTKIGVVKNSILQRCNNVLKWKDKLGNLYIQDCVYSTNFNAGLDYGSQGVPQIKADAKILVARNEETNLITFNQRFLFDGHAFQVKQIDNHYSKTLMTIYIFEVPLQVNDDLYNGIAGGLTNDDNNYNENDIIISPNETTILLDEKLDYSVFSLANGIPNSNIFEISASGLDKNNYKLDIVDGNHFSVTNLKKSMEKLKIKCIDKISGNEKTIEIELGGKW